MGFLVKSEKIQSSSGTPVKQSTKKTKGFTSSRSLDGISKSKSADYAQTRYVGTDGSSGNAVVKMSLKQRIRNARKKGLKGDVYDMQYLVEEGPLSFRSVGFVGGFWMILSSLLDFAEHDEDAYARLVTFNLWIIGFITIMIEGRPFHMQIPFVYDIICLFFSFLKYVWGRGFLYFVAGIFQFFLLTKYNIISGVYFMLLGAFSIVFGYRASVRLASLRNSISNKDEIKFMFHSFDKDRDGFLSVEEFRELLISMDEGLDHNDFVAAMSAVDMDNNQMVSYEDLEAWWEGYNDSDLPPGAGLCSCSRKSSCHHDDAHLMA